MQTVSPAARGYMPDRNEFLTPPQTCDFETPLGNATLSFGTVERFPTGAPLSSLRKIRTMGGTARGISAGDYAAHAWVVVSALGTGAYHAGSGMAGQSTNQPRVSIDGRTR